MTEGTHNSFITTLYTRKRFNKGLNNLHLADNDNLDNSGKFVKVLLLIEILKKPCLSNYVPERRVSKDDSKFP